VLIALAALVTLAVLLACRAVLDDDARSQMSFEKAVRPPRAPTRGLASLTRAEALVAEASRGSLTPALRAEFSAIASSGRAGAGSAAEWESKDLDRILAELERM
jgi:hypothetical protein